MSSEGVPPTCHATRILRSPTVHPGDDDGSTHPLTPDRWLGGTRQGRYLPVLLWSGMPFQKVYFLFPTFTGNFYSLLGSYRFLLHNHDNYLSRGQRLRFTGTLRRWKIPRPRLVIYFLIFYSGNEQIHSRHVPLLFPPFLHFASRQ